MPWRSAAERAEAVLEKLATDLDPRSPLAPTILLAARRLGVDADEDAALAFWGERSLGGLNSDTRYPWEISHARAPGATYCPAPETWEPWRQADAKVLDRDRADFELRLTLPISVSDGCELLDRLADEREAAAAMLEDTEPAFRHTLATYVLASHSWKDNLALYALGRRPRALERMQPFAIAIAAAYTPDARRAGHVAGRRFPFHEKPLVSASAMLASGLLALGSDVRLVAELAAYVAGRSTAEGWGDHDEPADVFTTFFAADLLARIDPSFDVERVAERFAGWQRGDGTWRALGPEVPWLTDAVAEWLRGAERPFASRFRFPHLPDANRDHKTNLPYYAYFVDLERLFTQLPGLAASRCQLAFMDLAGFRAFNNAYGQDLGDAVLHAIAGELQRIDDSVVIRDGGDEFLIVGAPGGESLPDGVHAFRESWPRVFRERFGEDAPPVVARFCLGNARGSQLRKARERLGREVGALKHREEQLGRVGLIDDLGALD